MTCIEITSCALTTAQRVGVTLLRAMDEKPSSDPRAMVAQDSKPGLTNPGARVFNHYSTFPPGVRIKSLGEDASQNALGAAGHLPLLPCAGTDSFCALC